MWERKGGSSHNRLFLLFKGVLRGRKAKLLRVLLCARGQSGPMCISSFVLLYR